MNMSEHAAILREANNSSTFSYIGGDPYTIAADPYTSEPARTALIATFSLVALICVMGNSLVIHVIVKNVSMHSATNFLLANLAVADELVGIFCVIPTLIYYVSDTWFLGRVVCKLYNYMRGLTTAASVSLLTALCVERYILITRPLRSKRILTRHRIALAVLILWLASAGGSAFVYKIYDAIDLDYGNSTYTYCIPVHTTEGEILIYNVVSFLVWYLIPLLLMTCLYGLTAKKLLQYTETPCCATCYFSCCVHQCKTGPVRSLEAIECKKLERRRVSRMLSTTLTEESYYTAKSVIPSEKEGTEDDNSQDRYNRDEENTSPSMYNRKNSYQLSQRSLSRAKGRKSRSIQESRRNVVRMLIAVWLIFAVCAFPQMLFTLMNTLGSAPQSYMFSVVFQPFCELFLFLSSALNPLVYAYFSHNFRQKMKDALCFWRRNKPVSIHRKKSNV